MLGGQEKDNEIYGSGNAYTAEFWEYDPRLGRRWNTDPIDDPSQSPYPKGGNRAINPLGGTNNCGGCALAGDATLKGNPSNIPIDVRYFAPGFYFAVIVTDKTTIVKSFIKH